jgi:hypothetical protein
MGYHMNQAGASFTMKRVNEKQALAAIKALAGKGQHDGRYSWVDVNFATKYDNLHDMMEEWRWELEYDDNGDVDNIQFTGEKAGDDRLLFEAIAPYVEPGSYIEMLGEDGARWKWKFDGKTCEEVTAESTYEDDECVTEQEMRRFTKLMEEFLASTPEITVKVSDPIVRALQAAGSGPAYIKQLWQDFLIAKQ